MKSLQPNKWYFIISGVLFASFGMYLLLFPPVASDLLNKQFYTFFGIVLVALSAMRFLSAYKHIKNEKSK